MSISLIADILNHPEHWPASREDTLTLLTLADRCDERDQCYPSVRDICHRGRLARRSAQESLARLESAGVLTRDESPGKTTLYTLHRVRGAAHRTGAADRAGGARPTARVGARPTAPESSRESSTESPSGLLTKGKGPERPRDARPVPKSQSLVGESRQVKRRKLRDQRSAKSSGTVIPSKAPKESPGDLVRRMIREGKA